MKDAVEVSLRNTNEHFGILHVEEVYSFDKLAASRSIYQTEDLQHPGVMKMIHTKDRLIGGKIEVTKTGPSSLLRKHRRNPFETRTEMQRRGWRTVVGFQTEKCSTYCTRDGAKGYPKHT